MTSETSPPPDDELPTLADAEWALRYDEYKADELNQVRASASKWQTALVSLSGLLVTGLGLSAPYLASTIQVEGARWSIIGGAGFALLLLAIAGWRATVAAAGVPEKVNGSDEFRIAVLQKVTDSTKALRCAQRLFIAAQAVLIGTVITAIVMSPVKQSVLPSASVVLHDGRLLCGVLLRDSPTGTIRLTLLDGRVEQFSLQDLAAIQPVGSC